MDKIVLFGDSITELSSNQEYGFNLAPALQHEYFRKLQVITHGYGGYNTEHARYILDPILDAETAGGSTVRLITIFFGTNDSAENNQQHVPLERYAENLQFLTTQALCRNIAVILIGPALVDEDRIADRSTRSNRAYSEAAREVAKKFSAPFLDLGKAFAALATSERDGEYLRDLLTDGVHFTGKAYKIMYEMLLRTIREEYPALRTENLPTILPHILDIDHTDLPASLWRG